MPDSLALPLATITDHQGVRYLRLRVMTVNLLGRHANVVVVSRPRALVLGIPDTGLEHAGTNVSGAPLAGLPPR